MPVDIRAILDFLLADRLREICERRGVSASGSRHEQRERVVRSVGGDVGGLVPLLVRAELVEFLATRGYSMVSGATRWELERLLLMLCAGNPRALDEQPLGPASSIRYERRSSWPASLASPIPPAATATSAISEKVFRSRVQRQRGLIYYVKDGDIWAAPSRHGASKRAPHCVHEAGVAMDHVTYLYYVDGEGDIARKRRDGAPLQVVVGLEGEPSPVQVFIGYARTDRKFLQELCAALSPLESSNEISVFFDERLDPGTVWEPALMAKVHRAEIAILLLSNDFFNSRYCIEVEWPVIEQRRRRGECELMPVLIRQCHFEKSRVGTHQLVRPNDRAVDDHHPSHDGAWKVVTMALVAVIDRVRGPRP